jgi:hypothetical protein
MWQMHKKKISRHAKYTMGDVALTKETQGEVTEIIGG